MLGPHESLRLHGNHDGIFKHLLGSGGITLVAIAWVGVVLEILGIGRDAHSVLVQNLLRRAPLDGHEPEENVLGADIAAAEFFGDVLCHGYRLIYAVCEFIKIHSINPFPF